MTELYDPFENANAERLNGILNGDFIYYKNKYCLKTMK
jgi:hypothetical protein